MREERRKAKNVKKNISYHIILYHIISYIYIAFFKCVGCYFNKHTLLYEITKNRTTISNVIEPFDISSPERKKIDAMINPISPTMIMTLEEEEDNNDDHEDEDDENEDHVKKCLINSIWCKQCENNQTEFEKYEYYEICKNCDCQEQNDEQNDENKNEDCNTGLNEDYEQDYEQDYERDIDQDESEMNEETNEQDQFNDEEEELSEIEIEKDDQTFDTFDDEYMNKKDN